MSAVLKKGLFLPLQLYSVWICSGMFYDVVIVEISITADQNLKPNSCCLAFHCLHMMVTQHHTNSKPVTDLRTEQWQVSSLYSQSGLIEISRSAVLMDFM